MPFHECSTSVIIGTPCVAALQDRLRPAGSAAICKRTRPPPLNSSPDGQFPSTPHWMGSFEKKRKSALVLPMIG
jgi:hypothetical protein